MMTRIPLALRAAAVSRASSSVSPAIKRRAKPRRIPPRAIGRVTRGFVESHEMKSRTSGMGGILYPTRGKRMICKLCSGRRWASKISARIAVSRGSNRPAAASAITTRAKSVRTIST